ncbi:unnamed protein product [Protopolystoma xenopodis]|uniref:Uncharacterized protein n=1 Tax=Protopolystoma xenopodis TaxID=117903 RepID=A0A3S5AVC7_9PLAT|nr:unnamed protein product [Protopolystoma xenopodis]
MPCSFNIIYNDSGKDKAPVAAQVPYQCSGQAEYSSASRINQHISLLASPRSSRRLSESRLSNDVCFACHQLVERALESSFPASLRAIMLSQTNTASSIWWLVCV